MRSRLIQTAGDVERGEKQAEDRQIIDEIRLLKIVKEERSRKQTDSYQ
jgi:hypothetical protein